MNSSYLKKQPSFCADVHDRTQQLTGVGHLEIEPILLGLLRTFLQVGSLHFCLLVSLASCSSLCHGFPEALTGLTYLLSGLKSEILKPVVFLFHTITELFWLEKISMMMKSLR